MLHSSELALFKATPKRSSVVSKINNAKSFHEFLKCEPSYSCACCELGPTSLQASLRSMTKLACAFISLWARELFAKAALKNAFPPLVLPSWTWSFLETLWFKESWKTFSFVLFLKSSQCPKLKVKINWLIWKSQHYSSFLSLLLFFKLALVEDFW